VDGGDWGFAEALAVAVNGDIEGQNVD
jgi:hypothetical protein